MAKKKMGNGAAVKGIDIIFHSDEMQLRSVNPDWAEEEMLEQDGIFYLKDVAQKLEIPSGEFKKEARKLDVEGKSPWDIMGIRKAWTHWQVRMRVFGPFYKKNWLPKIRTVDKDWDGNELLSQKGRFYLVDVCEKIPFTTHQIRYQVRRNKDAKKEYGVWKDEQYNSYLVDMEIFSEWMRKIWLQGSFNLDEGMDFPDDFDYSEGED